MNRYEKYKDSGIEWIGEIPKHWETIKIKYVASVENGSTPKSDNENYWGGSLKWFTPFDFKNKDELGYLRESSRKITQEGFDNSGCSLIQNTSLLMTTRAPVGNLSKIEDTFTFNQGCRSLTPNNIHLDYLYFYLLTKNEILNALSNGTTFTELPKEKLLNFVLSKPPLEEQKLISRYLNKKTNQIDSLVEKLQKKIELLKEQRTALINQSVTKGLDPTVEMKDSGIEWIGKIPKHWEINKLKFISHSGVQYGLNIESDSYHEVGIRFLRITDINANGTLKKDGGVFLPPENIPEEYFLKQNDILFSRSGGTVGKSTRIDLISYPMSFAGYLVKFSFDNEEVSKFIKWVTESSMYWNWIDLQIIQSTIQNVNGEKYSNFSFALPTEIEIADINNLLNKKTSMIDKTISKYEKKIDLLFEYRQSLISSVVTGKIRITEEML